MNVITVPAIVTLCYVLIQALKTTKLDSAWFPLISCGIGALLGLAAYYLVPGYIPADNVGMALIIGGVSGWAATGVHQTYKQLTDTFANGKTEE